MMAKRSATKLVHSPFTMTIEAQPLLLLCIAFVHPIIVGGKQWLTSLVDLNKTFMEQVIVCSFSSLEQIANYLFVEDVELFCIENAWSLNRSL